jgi:hypothetical protein
MSYTKYDSDAEYESCTDDDDPFAGCPPNYQQYEDQDVTDSVVLTEVLAHMERGEIKFSSIKHSNDIAQLVVDLNVSTQLKFGQVAEKVATRIRQLNRDLYVVDKTSFVKAWLVAVFGWNQ